jgi:quercetin dioxygenase-like cupin family protein
VSHRLSILALVLGLAAPAAGLAGDAGVTVTPRFSHGLANLPGQAVTAVEVAIAPGASSAPHHHAGAVYVYVLAGTVRLALDRDAPRLYHAGDSFFEPPGALHAVSENPSKTEPAKLLAVFVAPEGAVLTRPAAK